jgi:[ribosomal protein S5]-alanine N-acetyltransferase
VCEPVLLTTSRLLLRPYRLSDIDAFFAYRNDPEWARYTSGTIRSRGEAESSVRMALAAHWCSWPTWAITVDDEMVGSVNLKIADPMADGEISYSLARALWGRGIATEAASAVVGWGFTVRNLRSIWASTNPRNTASVRVMERLWMTFEALQTGARMLRGEAVDEVFYRVTSESWRGAHPLAPDSD